MASMKSSASKVAETENEKPTPLKVKTAEESAEERCQAKKGEKQHNLKHRTEKRGTLTSALACKANQ